MIEKKTKVEHVTNNESVNLCIGEILKYIKKNDLKYFRGTDIRKALDIKRGIGNWALRYLLKEGFIEKNTKRYYKVIRTDK